MAANERYHEWEDELPSFNESPEVPDDVDLTGHPLKLHRLSEVEQTRGFVNIHCWP